MDNINAATPTTTTEEAANIIQMPQKVKISSMGALFDIAETPIELPTGEQLLVKQKIPYEEVFDMTEWCVNRIIDDRAFISSLIYHVIKDFAILKFYTNADCDFLITTIDEKKIYENYDILSNTDIMDKVYEIIDKKQLNFFETALDETLNSIIAYRNSAKGIVDVLTEDAASNSATIEEALNLINEPEKREEISKLLNFYAEEVTK